MKILQVISSFPPAYSYGGALRVAYNLSKNLVANGHQVTVYTTDVLDKNQRNPAGNNPCYLDGIEIFRFRNVSNRLASGYHISFAPGIVPALDRNGGHFDIIHCHEYRSFEAVAMHHSAKKNHVPYILQSHGTLQPSHQKQHLKEVYDLFWGDRILADAARCFALTETESDQFNKRGVPEARIQIMPNGIDIAQHRNSVRGIFKNLYHIPPDSRVILYLGRLHKSKGIELLVEAFADIGRTNPKVKLVIIGPDDGFKETLIRFINHLGVQKDILLIDYIAEDEKLLALHDADIFVTPRFSGFPITFLEACASGTPIITTTDGDDLGWIDDQVGYVVGYDKDQLREKIHTLLNDEDLKKRFGEKGRQLVRDRFNWDIITREVERNYAEILDRC
jgi:glycosyltransferase involved in cell wall biosynthesis